MSIPKYAIYLCGHTSSDMLHNCGGCRDVSADWSVWTLACIAINVLNLPHDILATSEAVSDMIGW